MIAAIVPAAGRSTRMGRPKLLLTLGGETLIHHVVTALREGGVGRVIVVAPPTDAPEGPTVAAEAVRAGAEVLTPQARPAEMRQSVELGLQFLDRDPPPQFLLVTPGDVPGISPGLVARLLVVAAEHPDCLVVPRQESRRGHPIVLPWDVAAQLPALPATVGLNVLVARHKDRLIEFSTPESGVAADLNTPEDWHRWSVRQARSDSHNEESDPRTLDRPPGSTDKMLVKVRLFAIAKQRTGLPELALELPPAPTVADLRAALHNRLPELGPLWSRAMIAVDEEYAGDDRPITAGSQLAVIPPVSGGTCPGRRGHPVNRTADRETIH
jgi:molybdenum cofactor cytidylyltransferase